jgi:Tat protein secretion system quality control protein TatD with DNase activity
MISQLVPLGQLFTETDAPYLSAVADTFPNEPAAVVSTVAELARIKNMTADDCRNALFMNYQRLFAAHER